jgi:hypothetical protein
MVTERLPIVRDSDILFAPRRGRVLPAIHLGPASAGLFIAQTHSTAARVRFPIPGGYAQQSPERNENSCQ